MVALGIALALLAGCSTKEQTAPEETGAETDWDGDGYTSDDCAPRDPEVHPGAVEVCNVVDDDCDGEVDEGFETGPVWYDGDGDGYGDARASREGCLLAEGWATNGDDCDSHDARSFPGAEEVCDLSDNDCDGLIDEELTQILQYYDDDWDGHGTSDQTYTGCVREDDAYVESADDCLDQDDSIHPGAIEDCTDGDDGDCDGLVDCEDEDCEAASTCAERDCADGLDEDEDGYVDCADDECWGAGPCPGVRVARVLWGEQAVVGTDRRNEGQYDSCGETAVSTVEVGITYRWEATEIAGSLRWYAPGASAPEVCAWNLRSAASIWRYRRVIHWVDDVPTSSVPTSGWSSARVGFTIESGCGVYDSAFLPGLPSLREAWLDWYNPRWSSHTFEFGDDDDWWTTWERPCEGLWVDMSNTSTLGVDLGWGERYVYTTASHTPLRDEWR